MYSLNVCHLYPDLLNMYGDRGNVIAIRKRCEWREIEINITSLSIGEKFNGECYDIVFIGGGQDNEQEILQSDLLNQKGAEIKNYVNSSKVLLAICGGYQLLGNYYITQQGNELKFLGALNLWTVAGEKRMIGNAVCECDFIKSENNDGYIVGFTNHSGKTFLGTEITPLGKIIKGFGNNDEDNYEGAIFKNTFCSYYHGSLLPKNPALVDYLISNALKNKYSDFTQLQALNDNTEFTAHNSVINKIAKNR